MSDKAVPPNVVVLGGGSAGWITACLIHKEWGHRGGSVTLVESPEIGIIGVGEGSTPQLKALLDHLGIDEAAFMTACDATYKLGIRFTGWSERPGFESYFHPFPGPVDLHTEPGFVANCALARRGFEVPALPDDWFLAARLADERKSPMTKYLHTMIRVTDPEATVRFFELIGFGLHQLFQKNRIHVRYLFRLPNSSR